MTYEPARQIEFVSAELVDLRNYGNILDVDLSNNQDAIPVVKVTFRSDVGLINLALYHNVDFGMIENAICEQGSPSLAKKRNFTIGGVFANGSVSFNDTQKLAKLSGDSHTYFVFVDEACSPISGHPLEHLQAIQIALYGGDRSFIEQKFQSNVLLIPLSSIKNAQNSD